MDKKDKSGKLLGLSVDVAKNGYELCIRREQKQTMSQKYGWVPAPYKEPDKYVAKTVEDLLKQIKECLKDCKDCKE